MSDEASNDNWALAVLAKADNGEASDGEGKTERLISKESTESKEDLPAWQAWIPCLSGQVRNGKVKGVLREKTRH